MQKAPDRLLSRGRHKPTCGPLPGSISFESSQLGKACQATRQSRISASDRGRKNDGVKRNEHPWEWPSEIIAKTAATTCTVPIRMRSRFNPCWLSAGRLAKSRNNGPTDSNRPIPSVCFGQFNDSVRAGTKIACDEQTLQSSTSAE